MLQKGRVEIAPTMFVAKDNSALWRQAFQHAPGQPQLQATMISRSVTLSWPTPASNGAPIQGYEVSWSGGTLACAASPCVIPGLTNGQDYSFKVRAKNKADWSDWSPSVSTTLCC